MIPHGTANAYKNYHCRCDACRAAWAEYTRDYLREWRHLNRDLPVPEYVHGTENGYINYGCRCERCRVAGLAGRNRRRQARAARQVRS